MMEKLEFKAFFHALGDYSRFVILHSLAKQDMSVGEIVSATGIEQSNVSHHMYCLLNCGFVNVRKDGNKRIYRINEEVKETVEKITEHIDTYKKEIISCGIANGEYISGVI
jgi:DNA-binding transcriptional ArsR family regulator